MEALIKDSEQLASMIDNIPSLDNLDFIMESDALGHTIMDQTQGYECLIAVAETVTLEEVCSSWFLTTDHRFPICLAPNAPTVNCKIPPAIKNKIIVHKKLDTNQKVH
jgi:hypothetical protein